MEVTPSALETRLLAADHDAIAPDGSEIRLLAGVRGASVCHCTLPVGAVSRAVRHRSVEEVWVFISGQGEVWRERDGQEEITPVGPGVSLNIPLGTRFQFRNTGAEPLCFIIATLPPWPGEDEAVAEAGHWDVPATKA
jgi:mannose-6-phosphate isomerase-like protein (cupin superfamily)